MPHKYTLEWIDLVITVTLNPKKTDLSEITDTQIEAIISRLTSEKEQLESQLKHQVFGLTKQKQIELLIKQYHSALIVLLDQAFENQNNCPVKNQPLKNLNKALISCLDELLSFIEVRFNQYLSLEQRVPVTYLLVSKKELQKKLNKLEQSLIEKVNDQPFIDIVLNPLYAFINDLKENLEVSFQELLYRKELLKELELLENPEKEIGVYTALNELLIYLNFNSKAYMDYFTKKLAEKTNSKETITEKMDELLIHYKAFNQLHRKPGIVLNPQYADLKTALGKWFKHELFYLEKKRHLAIMPMDENTVPVTTKDIKKHKILSMLSVDQMALILRSADDLKILIARSMNAIFKTIVPHLSTPHQVDLSYDSMRSKSYSAETRDKEIVIDTLQQMIDKIQEY
jgi:hypothetical protein